MPGTAGGEHRSLTARFLHIAGLLRGNFKQSHGALGLTLMEAVALLELPDRDGLPARRLAEAMKIDPANLTDTIDRLERRGLISRQPDIVDRRVKRVTLTEAGRQTRGQLRQLLDEGDPIDRLDEADRRDLDRLLARLEDVIGSGAVRDQQGPPPHLETPP